MYDLNATDQELDHIYVAAQDIPHLLDHYPAIRATAGDRFYVALRGDNRIGRL